MIRLKHKPIVSKRKLKTRLAIVSSWMPLPEEDELRLAVLTRVKRRVATCGEIVDVLMDIGYRLPIRDFRICVEDFTKSAHRLLKEKCSPLNWNEILGIANMLGYDRRRAA